MKTDLGMKVANVLEQDIVEVLRKNV